MTITITITMTAFGSSPDGGKGSRGMNEPAHRTPHPFCQTPTDEEGELALFETSA